MNRLIQIPDFLLLIPFRQCLDERFRKVFAFGKTLNLLDEFIGYQRGDFHGQIIRWFIVLFQPLLSSNAGPRRGQQPSHHPHWF